MDGAALEVVRDALDTGDPLPGTGGFAGEVDGRLVRDVLGRYPLFSERGDETRWSTDRTDLDDPVRVPPGVARDAGGDEVVWSLPEPPVSPPDEAIGAVRDAVSTSVRDVDSENLAVAFSGGVDSGLVAAGVPDAPLYVAGFEGSHDVAAATAAADAMDRELRVVELTHDALRQAVPELVSAIGRDNPMDIQIALPLYLTAKQVSEDGYDRLAVGQGADELFGGYSKVVAPATDHRVEADTVRGATREVVATLPDQLERDVLALRAASVEPVAPLLHDRVVDAALRLPAELLATEDERKVALRRAADGVLPDSVTSADKKAVQYGTYAARELDRLARQAGFKRRMDDHVGQYIRSLCEE
ncbi:asparagine synthase (glutamine-hydrolysing) [Halogranum rubrum]|uniref:Asparagine synthase (Glutamine-hydrolysing) n=1 Tax=Halogranum rubrum TaxID=553466 RepID=A0A1I4EM59_9EURY|nr:asparagine synthase-related protein [Halogranum rubrum]SFL06815.1 asparagine synthase (glutamine-hydrolysing) [Halogranum rubrum]